jgi:tRNA (adenine22-N1)-methyltransferase
MLEADRSRARFRVGDGISVLDRGEVDTIVIAGMGGMLIRDIMSADFELTCSFRKYILQPRKRQGHLRKWLLENGFTIIHEDLVEEGRFIPEIITALSPKAADDAEDENSETEEIAAEKSAAGEAGTKEPGAGTDCRNTDSLRLCIKGTAFASPDDTGEDIIYRVPPWITQASGPVEDFLVKNITSEQEKLENVMLAKERNMQLEDRICRSIRYLRNLLEEYRNGR